MHLLFMILLLTATFNPAISQADSSNVNELDFDTQSADPLQDNMRVTAAYRSMSTAAKSGRYVFWSLMVPPSNDPMRMAIDHTSSPDKSSLWGRFEYDAKDIIFFVDDIADGGRSGSRLSFDFTWRARSTEYGSVMHEDDQLTGSISFIGDGKSLQPPRDIELSLGGASMWRESYVEANRQGDLDTDESALVKEIKGAWEKMAQDENKVDMDLVRQHHGCIMSPDHLKKHREQKAEL